MKEIGATIPKYQPLRVLWRTLCNYALRTILSQSIRQFTKDLVPSLFEESISRSWSKSVQTFSWYSLTNSFLLPQKFYLAVFFSFFHFDHTLFCGLAGAYVNPGSFFKLTFCTFICLSNNSLISSWISAKFVSALLLCILYLSYYFQSEVNTWIYLRRAIALQVDGYHNLDPLQMICINFQVQVMPMQYSTACICLYFQK